MKITLLDGFSTNPGDLSWEPFKELGDLKVYDLSAPEQVVERSRGCEVLLTNKTKITASDIAALPELKYIGILATGLNAADVDAASAAGITVTNIPAYSTMSVMQMVFAHLLAITNRVEHYTGEIRKSTWLANPDFCYTDFTHHELAGKRMGIVGYGNIGSAVAAVALAMGMKPYIYTSKPQEALPAGMKKAPDLDTLFAVSDVVSLHCPLAEDTHNLVNRERLHKMKPTAILINTARGLLVDEEALAEALNEGRILAAGLDVMPQEPPRPDSPLLTARNCFLTPHMAWGTLEARARVISVGADNLRRWLEGNPVNVVSQTGH